MVSLVDIAPACERVTVRGQEVEVFGVSAAGVAMLLSRFPELRKLFSGREVGFEEIMGIGGELVAAIIAAGTGDQGDPVAEEAAGWLGIDEQADLLAAILRVSLPKGSALSSRSCWRSGTRPGPAAPSRARPRHRGSARAGPSRRGAGLSIQNAARHMKPRDLRKAVR